MLPTMSESGDLCWEWNLPAVLFGPSTLRRGQLVTFTSPLDPSRTVCKRLVGLPGDIVCVDPTGLKAPSSEHVVVPRHHIWVMGDNAAMSRDSRDYGPLHMSLLRGRIAARVSYVFENVSWFADLELQILPLRDFKIFENTWTEVD
jgi:inner membrane protease subunit 1